MKSCASCAFCKEDLQGYSCWTITGATYDCMGNMNPMFPFDNESGKGEVAEEMALSFADSCPAFFEGTRLVFGMEDDKQDFADWVKQFTARTEAATK